MITNANMTRAARFFEAEENPVDAMFGVLWTLGKAHVENGAWVLDDEEIENLEEADGFFTFDYYDFYETKIEAVEDAMWQIAWNYGFAKKDANGEWVKA